MSLFSQCDLEGEVQLNDKTRFSVVKSFNTKDSNEINSILVSPGLGVTAIDCFSQNEESRYLDWSFSTFAIDVDSSNNTLLFNESTGLKTATLTSGSYTLTTYAAMIQTKMNLVGGQTYTVTVSSDNKLTVSASAQFEFKASPVQVQSFLKLGVSNTSHTSDIVEYGKRIITVTCSNYAAETNTAYFYINAYSDAGDYLYSSDTDLIAHEPDIMRWVTDGRSSFKNVHRRSQKLIIAWLDEKGFVNTFNEKYKKRDIIDIEELRQLSIFMTLRLIFQGLSNAIDDIFDRKSKIYELYEESARNRSVIRLDIDKDGIADQGETLSISSGSLFNR